MNPYLEVITAALIWGASGVFVKIINLNPFLFSFFRTAIPTAILLIYFIVAGNRFIKRNNSVALFASFLNAVRIFFYFVGFNYTSIGNAVIMLYTWPIFVAVFSIFILKDRITFVKTAALVTAFAGIVVIYLNRKFSLGDRDFLGMSAILVSACIYSLSMIAFKKVSDNYSKLEITFFQNLLGGFLFLPFLFVFKPLPSLYTLSLLTVYSALVGIVGFTLFFAALKKIDASVASNLAYLEVVSAVAAGALILHERITWNMIAGGLLIVSSVVIIQRFGAETN